MERAVIKEMRSAWYHFMPVHVYGQVRSGTTTRVCLAMCPTHRIALPVYLSGVFRDTVGEFGGGSS